MRVSRACSEAAVAALTGAFLLVPPPQEPAAGIGLLVDRVQETYQGAKDLQGQFVQRRFSRLGSVMAEDSGKVYIGTPGRMRMEYDSDGQTFVAGGPGRELYDYFPKDNQVQVVEAASGDSNDLPILYLSGRGNLRRDFEIEEAVWNTPLSPGNVQLELRPRRPRASFDRLILEVDPFRATIVRLVSFGNLGDTIEYQFHDIRFDIGLPDSLFEFEIPDGADVVIIGG